RPAESTPSAGGSGTSHTDLKLQTGPGNGPTNTSSLRTITNPDLLPDQRSVLQHNAPGELLLLRLRSCP
ncbi:hypothetical protein AMELA_G00266140, partial [Ameiurus melas]